MLMVSDLIEVALGKRAGGSMRERAPGRFEAARAPVVVWNVCRICNMTCPHCYIAAGNKPAFGELDTEGGLRLIDRLVEGGVRVLIFSGGEPLMREDLLQLIRHATDQGLMPHLSTNGVLIDEAVAAELADAGVRYVGISIDGLELHNDGYRGMAGGFRRATAGLRNASQVGIRTGLRVTLTQHNVDQLEGLYAHAESIGCNRFYVSHLVYSGRARGMVEGDLSPEQTRGELERLFELAEERLGRDPTIVTGANDSDGVALLHWLRSKHGEQAAAPVEELLRARAGNSAGEGVICIDSRGRVHPDPFWRNVTLGDLRSQSLEEVMAHPLVEQLREREQRLEGRCGACRFLPLCRGAHRGRAQATTGSIWAPDPACVMSDSEIGFPGPATLAVS